MRRCRRSFAGLLAACAAAAVSCGSAPSHDDYLSRGDAVCKQTAAAQAKLKTPPKNDLKALATYIRASANLIDDELGKLRKLSTPSGDGERLGDLLNREGDAIDTLRQAATAADRNDRKTAGDLYTQAQGELSDVGAGLRDYGFNVCGT